MINVTAAIIERNGKILLAKRSSNSSLPDKWEFPGGKIDEGETPEDCLARDLRTGRQIADQTMTRGNLALARNYKEGIPIRVSRGYSHSSKYSPTAGYRYDGLYRIDNYWKESGQTGFSFGAIV